MKKFDFKDFINFIKEQGVFGLAVGFILGGSISRVITSLVEDIINPILSIVLGAADSLETIVLKVGLIEVRLGNFLSVLIDFLIIAFVVYSVSKALGIKKIKAKGKVLKKKVTI